ncbi:MAG: hypothetical protein RID23_16295 [Roseovarius sp.]
MKYDLSKIMKAAWMIVRRFKGNGESHAALLSRALKAAWFKAREEVRVARMAAKAAEEREALANQSVAAIEAEIARLEQRNYLGHEGRERLRELHAALQTIARREAQEKKRALIASAAGRFASVTFTKKDGSRRVMRVQPATLKYHVRGAAASDAAQRAVQTRAERHPNLMPVWDADACAPRSVNLETVSRIAVNGAVHEFAVH